MGWHSVNVEGQKMWESSDGQRLRDPADIDRLYQNAPTARRQTVFVTHRGSWLMGFVTGFVVGLTLVTIVAIGILKP